MPARIDQYENMLTGNPIWMGRLKGVGQPVARRRYRARRDRAAACARPAWTGICARDMPYSGYEEFDFQVPVSDGCDVWARYQVRMLEMRESLKIVTQGAGQGESTSARQPDRRRCAEDYPARAGEDEDGDGIAYSSLQDRHRRLRRPRPARSSRRSRARAVRWATTSSRTGRRNRIVCICAILRSATLQALETMCKGRLLADVVAVIGVDRYRSRRNRPINGRCAQDGTLDFLGFRPTVLRGNATA